MEKTLPIRIYCPKERFIILRTFYTAFALLCFQKDFVNSIITEYISSLPAIIRKVMTSWENSLNMLKFPKLPEPVKATPALENRPSAEVMVASMLKLLKERSRQPNISMPMYRSICIVTEEAL